MAGMVEINPTLSSKYVFTVQMHLIGYFPLDKNSQRVENILAFLLNFFLNRWEMLSDSSKVTYIMELKLYR